MRSHLNGVCMPAAATDMRAEGRRTEDWVFPVQRAYLQTLKIV